MVLENGLIFKNMKYKEEIIRAMEWLGKKPNTVFTGQAIGTSGHAISTTMEKVPQDKRVELQILQQQCFDWLRANGGGDLIKSNVEVQFGKDEDEACNQFTKRLRDEKLYYKRAVGVHPATLNKYIQERLGEGKDVPLEMFRVYTGRKANIRRK
mgnify:CR=1 FL=1